MPRLQKLRSRALFHALIAPIAIAPATIAMITMATMILDQTDPFAPAPACAPASLLRLLLHWKPPFRGAPFSNARATHARREIACESRCKLALRDNSSRARSSAEPR
jgi:hypothetical protein